MFATATDGQKSKDFCILFHLISNSNLNILFFSKMWRNTYENPRQKNNSIKINTNKYYLGRIDEAEKIVERISYWNNKPFKGRQISSSN